MNDILKIIGLQVIDIRGLRTNYKNYFVIAQYILFDDDATYIELEDQDYYDYHDCSSTAREITVLENKEMWWTIFNDEKTYPKANCIW